MLKIKNLSKHFGGIQAVNNCTFDLQENAITALIGPNGSGKSTVFNLISGISKQDSGNIFFAEKNISHLSPEKVSNAGISRLFQQSQLFENLTVKENLFLALDNLDTQFWKNLFGRNKVTANKTYQVNQMLKLIEMQAAADKKVSKLSYGQQRLVEIARTILNPHKLIMLDEPLAGVNTKLRNAIFKLLLHLKKQATTILFIEHDMNFALNFADRVIVLDAGKVIATGTPEEIQDNKQVLKAYLGNSLC